MKKSRNIVEQWIEKATEDILFGTSILKHKDAPPSGVGFHSQQTKEFVLKKIKA